MEKNLIYVMIGIVFFMSAACGHKTEFVSPVTEETAFETEENDYETDNQCIASKTESVTEAADREASEPHFDENGKLRINFADKHELKSLSGIGDKKAEAIINYREQYGSFMVLEDIKNVKGIKDVTFNKIKDYITVD